MNEEEFTKLSKLCRIACTEEEKQQFLTALSSILAYMEQLKEIETEGVPPCNTVLETVSNIMREDEVGTLLSRDVFLANAPSHVGGMIRVPPVLKQE
jgi:aspartyl-tRNA(Asn)/glutamyl-tRNA(Gln) amidotransferase subunit C